MKWIAGVVALLVVGFLALIPRAEPEPPVATGTRLQRIEASCRREYTHPDAVQRCKAEIVGEEFAAVQRAKRERARDY